MTCSGCWGPQSLHWMFIKTVWMCTNTGQEKQAPSHYGLVHFYQTVAARSDHSNTFFPFCQCDTRHMCGVTSSCRTPALLYYCVLAPCRLCVLRARRLARRGSKENGRCSTFCCSVILVWLTYWLVFESAGSAEPSRPGSNQRRDNRAWPDRERGGRRGWEKKEETGWTTVRILEKWFTGATLPQGPATAGGKELLEIRAFIGRQRFYTYLFGI